MVELVVLWPLSSEFLRGFIVFLAPSGPRVDHAAEGVHFKGSPNPE